MAHVESTEGVRVALEAGVDTIEHGAPMTPQIVELYRGAAHTQFAGRKPSLTCTISPALPFAKLDPEKTRSTDVQKANGDIVCEGIIQSAREALGAGIDVGLGTDSSCPYVTQYDMWREVAYFAKYVGVSNAFALHTATAVNARLLGLGEETGTVEEGKSADLIVVERNPLDDLSALRDVRHVMCRGAYVERPRVKHIPELDAELRLDHGTTGSVGLPKSLRHADALPLVCGVHALDGPGHTLDGPRCIASDGPDALPPDGPRTLRTWCIASDGPGALLPTGQVHCFQRAVCVAPTCRVR